MVKRDEAPLNITQLIALLSSGSLFISGVLVLKDSQDALEHSLGIAQILGGAVGVIATLFIVE